MLELTGWRCGGERNKSFLQVLGTFLRSFLVSLCPVLGKSSLWFVPP